jgi:hypothetical protein
MMGTRYKFIIIIVIALTFSGCKKNYTINGKQHILFQYDYVNYAWGYVHKGFYVDDEGNVMIYQNPDNWNFHGQDYNLTEEQLSENIAKCTKSDIKVSKDELARFSSYIHNIASSKITAIKSQAADAGTSVFVCYDFSDQTGIYKGYLIKMEGDYTCENLNFYSKKVSIWLKEINNSLSKK